MANGETGAPKTGRRWGRVLLGLSLALNVLVLGVVLGGILGHRHDDGPDRRDDRFAEVGPYSRALSDADRAALRNELRAAWPQLRENRTAVRDSFREVLAALRAEPYDPGRVETLLVAQSDRISSQIALTRGLLLSRLAEMSPDERKAFADRLEQVIRRGPPRR